MPDDTPRNEFEQSPGGAPPPKPSRGKSNGAEAPEAQNARLDETDPERPSAEQLDAEEEEYRRMRRDLPGVQGAAAVGVVALGVSKAPDKNEFFRTKKGFCPVVDMVSVTAGMEHKFFVVDSPMLAPLATIGIGTSPYILYLTITTQGALRVIPVRCADETGERNEYAATKEMALVQGIDGWVRIYTDVKQGNYRIYPAPKGRFPEPVWPPLGEAKIFRLAFRDRGCLIDSVDHPRYAAWAASFQKDQRP
jgi:hypothetical protein